MGSVFPGFIGLALLLTVILHHEIEIKALMRDWFL
jgi:hypothetical protein